MSDVQLRNGLYGQEFREIDQRRANDEETRKTYDIKALWQRHHEIIDLALRGFKWVDIAKIVGVTPQTVSNCLNGELAEKKLSELREEKDENSKVVAENIRVLTSKALQVYHEIVDNEEGEATLKERKDVADTVVLELSGLRAPTKHISATLTAEEIEAFKARGKEAAIEDKTIDVEAE